MKNKWIITVNPALYLVTGITAFGEEADEGLVPVGLQKQLFVDDYVVAKKENVTLEVGQAKKYGVVMEPTLPTDF